MDLDGPADRVAHRRDLARNREKAREQGAGVTAQLADERFTARVPAEVVARERVRLDALDAEQRRLQELIAALGE